MPELQRTAITSDRAPQPLGAYSVGMSVNSGRLVYVAGQVGVDTGGNLVGPGMRQPRPARSWRTSGTCWRLRGPGSAM